MATSLTPLDRLTELEAVIDDGLAVFMRVGTALQEIKTQQLYKQRGYTSMSAYVKAKWGKTRQWANLHTQAVAFVDKLSTTVDVADLPDTEYGLRKLRAALGDTPLDVALQVVSVAKHIAKDVAPDGRVSAALVQGVQQALAGIVTTGAIGGEIALSDAFKDTVLEDVAESYKRNRQYVADALARKARPAPLVFEYEALTAQDYEQLCDQLAGMVGQNVRISVQVKEQT